MSESGFALVILHVDAVDALQCIADVGVGKLAHLVGRHHIGDAHAALLQLQGLALVGESALHLHLLQFQSFVEHDVRLVHLAVFDGDGLHHGRIAHIRHLDLVGAGLEVGQCIESVDVAGHSRVQILYHDGCSRQTVAFLVGDSPGDASETVSFGIVNMGWRGGVFGVCAERVY